MKRFYRHEADSGLGARIAYLEVIDECPARQVEVHGDVWRWDGGEDGAGVADPRYEALGLRRSHLVTAEEFERVWQEARRRCPRS